MFAMYPAITLHPYRHHVSSTPGKYLRTSQIPADPNRPYLAATFEFDLKYGLNFSE